MREFETIDSKDHCLFYFPTPEVPKCRNPEIHPNARRVSQLRGFSMLSASDPCHQDSWYAKPRYAEMSMFHTKGMSRFVQLHDFQY
jgi:hypothetical protein